MAYKNDILSNEKMATLLAKRCYSSNTDMKDFVVQLFIEYVCLPKEFGKMSYSESEMKQYILNYLNGVINEPIIK